MEYAVTAAARFRLSGSRAATIWPIIAAYVLFVVMAAGFVGVAWYVLRPALTTLLPMIALGVGIAVLAVVTASHWRTVPSIVIGRSGIVVEHPHLRGPLVVPASDVADVLLAPAAGPDGDPRRRFPVVDAGGVIRGWLYRWDVSKALTFFSTTPRHLPTVAVVFRTPRALPVRPFSVMRGPLKAYPVDDSYGLLLSVRDVEAVRAAAERAGLRTAESLPTERAVGLRPFPAD